MVLMSGASVGHLPVSWSRRGRWRSAAPLGVLTVMLLLESAVIELDHGTHLLVALSAILATALLLGPKPAFAGLALAAGVAAAASMAADRGAMCVACAAVQLLAYLFVGGVSIRLATVAVRPRMRMLICEPLAMATAAPGHVAAEESVRSDTPPVPVGATLAETLTSRELEILRLAATGVAVEEVARQLCVSPNTVKTHLTHIYAKLGVRGRSDAVRAALHAGCLTPADICPHHVPAGSPESTPGVQTPSG
jgi:DNA-binding CsgD family transcriptional regulator